MSHSLTLNVKGVLSFFDQISPTSTGHPHGEDESLFRFPLVSPVNGFTGFSVFSVSNYLRSLKDGEITLEMPSAKRRIEWLNKLFRQ
jgi:hypothetical protein